MQISQRISGFRPEIQALRALAVLLVLLYHLWPQTFPGGFIGVDMFFVISGFLITGNMVREAEDSGRLSLKNFWAARARRILPASLVATAVTVFAAMLVLPLSWFERIKNEALASVFYVQNWLLASDSVDYLAANNEASPFQHYWSLGVEEQFYLLWPLLVVLGVWIAGFHHPTVAATTSEADSTDPAALATVKPKIRVILLPIFLGLVLASFLYSCWTTNLNPNPTAYFSTFTRLWELGAGALLALIPAAKRLPTPLRTAALGMCFVGAAATTFLLNSDIPFPGVVSAIPVTLAALGLLSSEVPNTLGLKWFTELWPVQFLGNISYSLYLWHFPPIVLFTVGLGHAPNVAEGLGLAAVSILLATVSYYAVENPIRSDSWLKARPGISLIGAATTMAIVAGIACIPPAQAESTKERWAQAAATITPGPGELYGAPFFKASSNTLWVDPENRSIAPSPLEKNSSSTWPGYTSKCEHLQSAEVAFECEYFPAKKDASATIVLVGDSMVEQLIPAFIPLATEHDYRFVSFLHNSCPFSNERLDIEVTSDSKCSIANADTLSKILAIKPDLVITSAYLDQDFIDEQTYDLPGTAGMAQLWDELTEAGTSVMAVRNTPRAGQDFTGCMVKNYATPHLCDLDRNSAVKARETAFWDRMLQLRPDTHFVDLLPHMCSRDICPAVIGNVMPYRDFDHITIEFAKSLSDIFDKEIASALRNR